MPKTKMLKKPLPKQPDTTVHSIPDESSPTLPSFSIRAEGLPPNASEDPEAPDRWRVFLIYPSQAEPVVYEVDAQESGVLDLKVNALEEGEVLVRIADQEGNLRYSGSIIVEG
jgi:hypothetical protein